MDGRDPHLIIGPCPSKLLELLGGRGSILHGGSGRGGGGERGVTKYAMLGWPSIDFQDEKGWIGLYLLVNN